MPFGSPQPDPSVRGSSNLLAHELSSPLGRRLPFAVARGIDLFDCVLPTRNARNGMLFTSAGPLSIKHSRNKDDGRQPDETCGCPTCRSFSRAYLRHLFVTNELLGLRVATLQNLTFYLWLMREMRAAIREGRFEAWRREWGPRVSQRL